MDIREFDADRDIDLYVEGDVDSFRESFPGVSVPGSLITEFRDERLRLINDSHVAGFTAQNELGPEGFVVVSSHYFYVVPGAYIETIYVREEFRGSGVVGALLERAEVWAKANGARFLQLDVSQVNQRAIAAYEKNGFSKTRIQMQKPL